jgi:hypothetical protein
MRDQMVKCLYSHCRNAALLLHRVIGENGSDCCYGNQYSNGESCVTCEAGTDCSVIGTTLATQSLVKGYWRASTASTDVRPCWFANACTGNSSSSAAETDTSRDCTTTTASNAVPSSSDSSVLISDGSGCNDTTTASISATSAASTTYCTQGYKGPCTYTVHYIVTLTSIQCDDASNCMLCCAPMLSCYSCPLRMLHDTNIVVMSVCIAHTHTTTLSTLTDCAVCAEGCSNAIGYECTQCKSGTKAAIYTSLALLLLAIILLIWFMTLNLLGLSDGQDTVTDFSTFGCMNKIAALPWDKLRIPVVAFQIVTQFISITGLPLPNIYRRFLSWTDVFNLNLGWLLSLGCLTHINFYQKLLITTLGPFAVAAALATTYATVRRRNKVQAVITYTSQRMTVPARTSKLEKALAKHSLVFLAMTFLIYSTLSTTVFQAFACDTIDDSAAHKTSYLRADYSIQCGTTKHTLYRVYAGFMVIIYPLGIPALYA